MAAGLVTAAFVGLTGRALERARFGPTDEAAMARVEADVRRRFESSDDRLGAIASRVALSRDLIRSALSDRTAARSLFEALSGEVRGLEYGTGITVYGPGPTPVAWAGRVSNVPGERIEGPRALFVESGTLGPRLVLVEPITDRPPPSQIQLASVVVEQRVGQVETVPGRSDTFVLSDTLVPVRFWTGPGGATANSPYAFVVLSRDGQRLIEAEVSAADLAEARNRWRRGTEAALLATLGLALLLCVGPLLEVRRRTGDPRVLVAATATLLGILVGGRAILLIAVGRIADAEQARPVDLLLWALLLISTIWLVLDLIERRRVARRGAARLGTGPKAVALTVLVYVAVGAIDALLLWAYERLLQGFASATAVDLLSFSLEPLAVSRVTTTCGLILLHAGVIWTAALVIRLADVCVRRSRRRTYSVIVALSWVSGVAMALAIAWQTPGAAPRPALLVALGGAVVVAIALGRPRGPSRHASQAARLSALYAALLVPVLAMYPTLYALASEAKELLVAERYGPEAARLRDDLQDSLSRAREEIDALPIAGDFTAELGDGASSSDAAYQLWSQTDLAILRLTSAVELYGLDGRLTSRFALNLPDYAPSTYLAPGCGWDIVEEVSPFGSSGRHVLRASRGICEGFRQLGAIAIRVMLDYQTLPFISSRSPYLQSIGSDREPPPPAGMGRDIEFVVYGWSRAPLYVSNTSAWPLPDEVFGRLADSRAQFWETLERDGDAFRVHFLNDRGGIYALGYPMMMAFDHLVTLAELVVLAFVIYVAIVVGTTLFNALTSRTPASGRALLREVRSSFYRKLFLAFVAVALVPVFILAFATRAYFATRLRAGVEESAVQTATVAQRLVEDYATFQQPGTGALQLLDDQIMVVVGRSIDQAVNLYTGAALQATSERDLFASGQLSIRTPADVYRSIVFERLPTFVGAEELDGFPYLVAAAPVRAGGNEGIVTIHQTLRGQEIEEEIAQLDRQVLFASVLFVLLGASLGYWMAERIADPVNRLTRATRRIARGDLDARVVATSSDELRRLVEDFNRMAADLKRQRAELERTQRLEAWADMARQVAHDIKNPLTPIQLSAEHARRVNLDKGEPLSPVLDECVNAILTQVALLRQISAEFSSFASSPIARPEPTDLGQLIREAIEPYRVGLEGRIVIDVQCAPDLSPLSVDRTLFARALTNIIENALHAMAGQGRLTIRSNANASVVVTEITDTGIGLGQEAIARLFEPYFSTKATGTGLGLTIAKRNIELHGGTIEVRSQRDVGTTVTITLLVEPTSP